MAPRQVKVRQARGGTSVGAATLTRGLSITAMNPKGGPRSWRINGDGTTLSQLHIVDGLFDVLAYRRVLFDTFVLCQKWIAIWRGRAPFRLLDALAGLSANERLLLRAGQRWYIWARDEAFPTRFDSASVFVRRRHQVNVERRADVANFPNRKLSATSNHMQT